MGESAGRSAKIKIKDLPGDCNLRGIRFHDPRTGTTGYWYSWWVNGIWWKKGMHLNEVYPLFIDDPKEALEFEVLEET